MRKQFRHAREKQTGKANGVVYFSQIARMVEMSLATWDGSKASELNKSVGYFINADGVLDWDLTKTLDTSTVTGNTAAMPAGVGSSRTGWRAAQDAQRAAVNQSLDRKEKEIAAATKATAIAHTAPVPAPTLHVPRSRPKSKNEMGLCLTSGAHLKELEAVEKEKAAKEKEKENRAKQFWINWRPKVKAAEAALTTHGTPSKLRPGDLKALVVSRTGHCAKAPNNKSPEKPLLAEVREAMEEKCATQCPPTPTPGTVSNKPDDDNKPPTTIICEGCDTADPEVALKNDYAFCISCNARVPEMDYNNGEEQGATSPPPPHPPPAP